MFILGILSIIALEGWAFLKFYSRNPEEIEAPLKVSSSFSEPIPQSPIQ
jgi:hypothetical protein